MKTNFEVNTEYNRFFIKNKKVYLIYDINLVSLNQEVVDLEKIKKELKPTIDKELTISNITKKEMTLEFDIAKWLKSSITETIEDTPDKYEKKLKIKKLPSMILNNINQTSLEEIINGTFRNYLETNKKLKNKIISSMSCIMKPVISYFKFNYDSYYNVISISLKPEFRANPLILFQDEIKKSKEIKKIDFDKSVYSMLNYMKKK